MRDILALQGIWLSGGAAAVEPEPPAGGPPMGTLILLNVGRMFPLWVWLSS